MMSMMSIPQWIIPLEKYDYQKKWRETATDFEAFQLPLTKVLNDERFAETKKIQWRQIDNVPYYILYEKYEKLTFVAANQTDSVVQKIFSYEDLVQLAAKKFKEENYTISELKESDNYFNPRKRTTAKIVFDDSNKTWAYITAENPQKLYTYNKSNRLLRWLYTGLHSFRVPGLSEIGWLRKTLLIIISIFGVIISLTGVVLSYKYILRVKKKLKKRRK